MKPLYNLCNNHLVRSKSQIVSAIKRRGLHNGMTTKRWESLEVTWGYSRIIFKMRLLYCIVCYSDMVNRYPGRSQLYFLPGVHIMFQYPYMNSNIQTFTPNIWQRRAPYESCKISTPSHFLKLNFLSFLIMELKILIS